MSNFLQGFNYGFLHGMFRQPFYSLGWQNPYICNSSFPMFFTPSYNMNNFFIYSTPTVSIPNIFNYSMPKFEYPTNNFNFTSQFSYSQFALNNTQRESSGVHEEDIVISYNATELKNKWKSKAPHLTDAFYQKVIDISNKINCSPNDLMAIMRLESAGTFNPGQWNLARERAVGLIQFTEIAAKDLNTTLEKIEKMTAVEQLDYVEKFYLKTKKYHFDENYRLTAGDLYALTYLPGFANKEVLAVKDNDPDEYYAKNKALDENNDGKITKTDLAKIVSKLYA